MSMPASPDNLSEVAEKTVYNENIKHHKSLLIKSQH